MWGCSKGVQRGVSYILLCCTYDAPLFAHARVLQARFRLAARREFIVHVVVVRVQHQRAVWEGLVEARARVHKVHVQWKYLCHILQ